MFPQITIKHNIGNTLTISNELDIKQYSFLTDVTYSGVTSLSVENTSGFTASPPNKFLLLSDIGSENAEIVIASADITNGFTVSATKQNHSRGSKVSEIKWNKIQVFKSSTIDGTYTQVGSDIEMAITQTTTVVFDSTGTTSSFYKVRWINSITSDESAFSLPISVLTYPEYSAGKMFQSIKTLFGIQDNDKQINTEFLLTALNDARRAMQQKLFGIRQDWQAKFGHQIKVLAGRNYIDLPDDVDFKNTDRSVLAVRFLTNNILAPYNMQYIDKRSWNSLGYYSTGSETAEEILIGATTLKLKNAGDFFPNGGATQVATDSYNQVVLQVNYTGVDYDTNELLGVTGVTRVIPKNAQVWSRASMNQPVYYTVYDNKIVFSSVIPDMMQGNSCHIDYYSKMGEITDLYQEIPEDYRETYRPYIRWAIKYRKDVSISQTDADYVKFEENVESTFNNLYTGQTQNIITG
jgi:hypothetical protein